MISVITYPGSDYFSFEPNGLQSLAADLRDQFQKAEPFNHIVIPNFLPETILDKVVAEFPESSSLRGTELGTKTVLNKSSSYQMWDWGPTTQILMQQFNAAPFLSFLTTLTGIPAIIPDPYFGGGGLHQVGSGGYLKVHVDYNQCERTNLDRRLNLLLYLNRDWDEALGGHLELWDRKVENCKVKVLPTFNTCVIFTTHEHSFHGHPTPMPEVLPKSRRSLALYYFTNGRPDEEKADRHTTRYFERPGEVFGKKKEKRKHETMDVADLPKVLNGNFILKEGTESLVFRFNEEGSYVMVLEGKNEGELFPLNYKIEDGSLKLESPAALPNKEYKLQLVEEELIVVNRPEALGKEILLNAMDDRKLKTRLKFLGVETIRKVFGEPS